MIVSEPLRKGAVVEGVVKQITDFGAFVDLGGIVGLIHISQLSTQRIRHPIQVVCSGERVKVMVLKYDKERQRVSLGMKQLEKSGSAIQPPRLAKKLRDAVKRGQMSRREARVIRNQSASVTQKKKECPFCKQFVSADERKFESHVYDCSGPATRSRLFGKHSKKSYSPRAVSGKARIVSGGLPSLGKRR